ncbi:hypothetical protein AYI69_g6491 [Smittium culicis]|uniref:Uncharacterized protein n=1 Tax=Smittium culicis TaxID=133412 RepID=A0A1R1XYI8_9FUNG|nr:hypothetical protein AYI69_g6491 [Smittium culicis]
MLISRIDVTKIDPVLVKNYLKGIAQNFGVNNSGIAELFEGDGLDEDSDSGGGNKEKNAVKQPELSKEDLGNIGDLPSVLELPTPKPDQESSYSQTSPSPAVVPNSDTLMRSMKSSNTNIDDKDEEQKSIDELMRRFEALKKS